MHDAPRMRFDCKITLFCVSYTIDCLKINIISTKNTKEKCCNTGAFMVKYIGLICDEAKGCCCGTPQAGNFRGVCPLNRAKGVHRNLFGVTWLFRNLSAQMLMVWIKSAFFRRAKKHTGWCCGDACLAKTWPAVATLHYYIGAWADGRNLIRRQKQWQLKRRSESD